MQKAINYQRKYYLYVLVALIAFSAAGCSLLGVGALDKAAAVNKDSDSVTLKGYDPVAYFSENQPVQGKPEFSTEYNGAKWQFASKENRDAFVKEPEKFAPQYGGYCAWAVSHGYTADTDPQTGKVVGGKLYLNYNPSVAKKWNEDIPKFIADGDKNWNDLAGKAKDSRKDK